MPRTFSIAAAVLLSACRASPPGVNTDTGDVLGIDDTAVDASAYDGATIQILSPTAGQLVPWQEASEFTAAVYDADGEPLPITDVVWSSDIDDSWVVTGASFDDDGLDVGLHELRAEALLPNGDKVADSVGAVRVQHRDAGVYMGEVRVDVAGDFKGQELSGACFGVTTMVIDVYGEAAVGDTDCSISFLGYDMDLIFDFDFVVGDEGELDGAANLDFEVFEWPFDAQGTVDDGDLEASWGDSVAGFADIAGSLDLFRVNDDPDAAP